MCRGLYFPKERVYLTVREMDRKAEVSRSDTSWGKKIFTFLLGLGSLCFFCILFSPSLWKPSPEIRQIINESAAREALSPFLIEAVMFTESKYDEEAVSKAGAVGMMQLMPETAGWISEQSGLPSEHLESPAENIPLGAWYLNFLLKKYHNNEVLALAAYNAGRGNVDEWIEELGWKEDFSGLDEIPYPETREFVKSVVTVRDRLEEESK